MIFESIERQPVYQQVAARIRRAIVNGELASGEALPTERELSEDFGVSRASVREALRQLESQGLVTGGRTAQGRTVAGGGVQVISRAIADSLALQHISLDDLVELRCTIEAAALRRAASDPDRDSLADAGEALEVMRRPDVDAVAFDAADVRFHTALVEASGNQAMHAVMLAARQSQFRYLGQALADAPDQPGTFSRLATEHADILAAVNRGDGDRAAALVQAHIIRFYRGDVPGTA